MKKNIIKKRSVKIIIGIMIVCIVVGFFVSYKKKKSKMTQEADVHVITIQKGDVSKNINFSGTVRIRKEQNLRFNQMGTVISVPVKEGDIVQKGQVLASLDRDTVNSVIDRAELNLKSTQRSYEDTYDAKKDEKRKLKKSIDRNDDKKDTLEKQLRVLKQDSAASQLDIEAKKDEIRELKDTIEEQEKQLKKIKDIADTSEVIAAKDAIASQKTEVEDARKKIDDYQIIAPFDGIIRKIDFKVGDKIVADETKYVYIEDPDSLELVANVGQSDIIFLEKGQKAKITFAFFENIIFEGQITDVEKRPVKDETGGTQLRYPVRIAISDTQKQPILSGMTARISVQIEEKKSVLVVPTIALSLQNGEYYVKKVKQHQTNTIETEQIPVKIGVRGNVNTEILSGLNINDQIVSMNFNDVEKAQKNAMDFEMSSEEEKF